VLRLPGHRHQRRGRRRLLDLPWHREAAVSAPSTIPAPPPTVEVWMGAPLVPALLSAVDAYHHAVATAEAVMASTGPSPSWVKAYQALGFLDSLCVDLEELIEREQLGAVDRRAVALARTKLGLFRRRAAAMIEMGADLQVANG
jgi:hypothetical protein